MVTHVSDTVCEQNGEEELSGEGNSHQLSEEQVIGYLLNLKKHEATTTTPLANLCLHI